MLMRKGGKYLFPRIAFLTVLMMLVLTAAPAGAASIFGFTNITDNNSGDAVIGEAQLFVEMTDPGDDQVKFTFTNTGPEACSIADVYFDTVILSGIADIYGSTGVLFSKSSSPGNLPGGSDITPPFTAAFSADSDSSVAKNGVDPYEWLVIVCNLEGGKNFDNVFNELVDGYTRIGIHVQAFDSGGSEGFVNNNNPVPLPASVFLLGSGLIGLVGFRRKKIAK